MDPDLVIERFAYTDMGVFGRMFVEGQQLFTVERPWLRNERSVSCIPEGQYRCIPRFYNRGGYDAIEITDVPDRTHILFHRGNRMHDVAGCIAVTSNLGCIDGVWAGLRSRRAFQILMDAFGAERFVLEIRRHEPRKMKVNEL